MTENFLEASYLIQAVLLGDLSAVKDAIWVPFACDKADVNEWDSVWKRSPLHAAAYFGRSKIADVLISAGARVNCKDSLWFTPLHLACYSGHEPTVEVLLKHNAIVNVRDKYWLTPFHVAVANNSYDCVNTLIPHITNINVTDRGGRTGLHHAALNQLSDMTKLLIRFGCAVNACDKRYRRPLHWAVQKPQSHVLQALVLLGADVNARDKDRFTPLHACSNSAQHAKILLDAGAAIDSKTVRGNTPLHIACINGFTEIVKELMNYDAPLEDLNIYGETALILAAVSKDADECMEILLLEGANVNAQSNNGQTALHRAARHGRFGRADRLLASNAEVDLADRSGSTALHIAASKGYDLMCYTLLDRGADPRRTDNRGRTALHLACRAPSVECVRIICKKGLNLDLQDMNGSTALHIAAKQGSIHCLNFLISNGVDLNITDNLGRTALHYAADFGSFEAVYSLVFMGSNPQTTDHEGCLPLHFAASGDFTGDTVNYLLKHCDDVNIPDSHGYTPLSYAVMGKNLETLKKILTVPSICLQREDIQCPINLAASYGYVTLLILLLPLCGKEMSIASNGFSPIAAAAGRGEREALELLLQHYQPPPETLITALERGVAGGSLACVATLLQFGVEVNHPDENGRTVLFRAVFSGNVGLVEVLARHGADILHQDKFGKTAIHLAAQCGGLATLTCLLRHCPQDQPVPFDHRGFSLLHWSCHRCHPACVELLLSSDKGSQWSDHAFTPVHAASMHANERCLAMLLNARGSDAVTLRDQRGRTPLHIATICNSIACIKFLIANNASLDAIDNDGRTPYQLAAKVSLSNAMTVLLDAQSR